MTLNEELQEARKAAMLKSLSSFYYFFKLMFEEATGAKLIDNWHIEYICRKLQNIGIDLINNDFPIKEISIFNVPPGTSKSTLISVLFPLWLWLHRPDLVIISTSYSATLSEDLARKSKKVLTSEIFTNIFYPYFKERFGRYFKLVKDTEGDFENNFGGRRFATSTGGTILGIHAHLIIVDDNLSAQQSHSAQEVMKSNRYFSETLMTRKKDKEKTKTIVVMQRLKENDLTGYLLNLDPNNIDLTILPAIETQGIQPHYLKQFYQNGLMDPQRMNQDVLDKYKVTLGSLSFSSQFLQNPFSEEGGILHKSWFDTIKSTDLFPNLVWDIYCDGAYTKNTANDPTGILFTSVYEGKLICKEFLSKHLEMPELIKEFEKFRTEGKITNDSKIFIEPKASGLSLVQLLRPKEFNSIAINTPLVNEGKQARAHLIAPFAEAKRIVLVEGFWNDEFIMQLCGFPNAKHDEAIDCLGYSVDKNLRTGVGTSIYVEGMFEELSLEERYFKRVKEDQRDWVDRLIEDK